MVVSLIALNLQGGIRQEDPLSSYIFILCMEYLNLFICKAVETKLWKGIRTSIQGPTLSHLFFADDVIFFAKRDERLVGAIKGVL